MWKNYIKKSKIYNSIELDKFSKVSKKDNTDLIINPKGKKEPSVSTRSIKYFAFTLFAILIIVFLFYVINYNSIPFDNKAKLIWLFAILSGLIGSFNYGFDIARFRSHDIKDYGWLDIWTLAHLIRDIFLFMVAEYYLNNAWVSFVIIMIIAIVFELLESLWDREAIQNKISDLLMVIVGSIIGNLMFIFLVS